MSSKEFGNFGLVHKISQINFRHINILRGLIIVHRSTLNYERKNEIQNSSVPKFDVEAKNSTAWRKLGTVSPFVSAIYIINRLDRETDLRNPSLRIARSWSSGETDIGSRIFFEVVSEGKQVVNVPSEFVCQ